MAPTRPQQRFLPFLSGRFTVAAGLSRLGGENAFDIDCHLPEYLEHKVRVLTADAHKYFRTHDFPAELEAVVVGVLLRRLDREHPGFVRAVSGVDALARQVQEDIVVIRRDAAGRDFNAAIHLCSPNGWAPAEKIGWSFFETHEPVAEFEKLNARAAQWVDLMINSPEGLVRYVWGVRPDDHLDHHPDTVHAACGEAEPAAYVRVERQTTLGLPDHDAAIFLVRTYLYATTELSPGERSALATALESMSPATARYKGILEWRPGLIASLRAR